MNISRLQLMVTMLNEVLAGTWKPVKVSFAPQAPTLYEQSGEQFDLGRWYMQTTKVECGFSACAMGHAALDSRFRKMGLKLTQDQYGFDVSYEGVDNFDGVLDFFKIVPTEKLDQDDNQEIAYILFSPSSYPEHLKGDKLIIQVIRRIERLIEMGQDAFFKRFNNNGFDGPSDNAANYLISKAGRIYKSVTQ